MQHKDLAEHGVLTVGDRQLGHQDSPITMTGTKSLQRQDIVTDVSSVMLCELSLGRE